MSSGGGEAIKSSVEVEGKANEGIVLMPSGFWERGRYVPLGSMEARERVEEGLGWVMLGRHSKERIILCLLFIFLIYFFYFFFLPFIDSWPN